MELQDIAYLFAELVNTFQMEFANHATSIAMHASLLLFAMSAKLMPL